MFDKVTWVLKVLDTTSLPLAAAQTGHYRLAWFILSSSTSSTAVEDCCFVSCSLIIQRVSVLETILITLYLCSFNSFTSSVRVSAYTRARSLTSSLIWRTWAFTAQRITILLILVSQETPLLQINACVSGAFVFTSLSSLFSVIEVASGEYGDLNPVLFDAVQGGLCSEESKKNSRDKSDSSCPSQCYSVSDTSSLIIAPHLQGLYYIYSKAALNGSKLCSWRWHLNSKRTFDGS